jgi:trk system potassium uptake protein TrkA
MDTRRWCNVHVVVVGCGRVGSGLAATLVERGHTVSVIDRKATAFRRLPDDFPGDTIVGVGFDRDRLRAAGIERAGALAAVTNGDNSNVLIARTANEFFKVERVVARIYDQRRAAIYERLGISTVATVRWAIERVLRRIEPDVDGVEWVDPSAKVCLVERVVPSSWAGAPLTGMETAGATRVVALTRLGVAQVIEPAMLAQEGDVVWVAVDGEAIDAFDRHLAAGPSAGVSH